MTFKKYYLAEAPWVDLNGVAFDLEAERFTRSDIPSEVSFENLKSFLRFIKVGDIYETPKQPAIDLNKYRDIIIDSIFQ